MKKFKNLIYLLTALVPFLTLAQTNPRMLDQGTPTTGTRDVSVRKVEKRLNIPITTGTEAGLYPDVPIKGAIRLNSATNLFEYHDGSVWKTAGASTQDNIDIVKVIIYTSDQQSQRFSASQAINNLSQFTLTETQSLWLKVMPDLTVSETLNPVFLTTKYKVFNKGKGTYGIGGSIQLEESDVELMYSNQLIVGDIINLESTDIISITSLAGQTISQYVNSHAPAYIIQSQSEGYTIFQIGTDPDNLISYLYLGEGGTFGQGSGQTTDADFQLLNNSAELPAEQGLQEVTDVGTISIYNEAGLTSAVALNTPGQEGRESAFKYNDGDKNSDVRITKSLILLRNDSSVLGKVSEVSLENGELAFNVIGSNLGESYTYQTRFPTPTENVFMNFPNKPSGDYTLATLDDIPTGGNQDLQSVLDIDNNTTTPINLNAVPILFNDNTNTNQGGILADTSGFYVFGNAFSGTLSGGTFGMTPTNTYINSNTTIGLSANNGVTINTLYPLDNTVTKGIARNASNRLVEFDIPNSIKSNESLLLAKRNGDVLYGILDQYTGEEITLSKITSIPTGNIVDNIIYFQLGSELFKRVFTQYNIQWFGAKGDGVTDCTNAIQNCINSCYYAGGGTILTPTGIYIIGGALVTSDNTGQNPNSQLYIPSGRDVSGGGTSVVVSIKFIGEGTATMNASGFTDDKINLINKGCYWKSTLPYSSTSGVLPSVIGTKGDNPSYNFNIIDVVFEDMWIRTHHDSTVGTYMTAFNMLDAAFSTFNRCRADIDVAGWNTVTHQNMSIGIAPTKTNGGTTVVATNCTSYGYQIGYTVGEHSYYENLNANFCNYAYDISKGGHGSLLTRCLAQWNKVVLSFNKYDNGYPTAFHFININELVVENVALGKWYDSVVDVEDTTNGIQGNCFFTKTVSGAGVFPTTLLTKVGGLKLNDKHITRPIAVLEKDVEILKLVVKNDMPTSPFAYASTDYLGGSSITESTKLQVGQSSDGTSFVFNNANKPLEFYTNGAKRMSIGATGDITYNNNQIINSSSGTALNITGLGGNVPLVFAKGVNNSLYSSIDLKGSADMPDSSRFQFGQYGTGLAGETGNIFLSNLANGDITFFVNNGTQVLKLLRTGASQFSGTVSGSNATASNQFITLGQNKTTIKNITATTTLTLADYGGNGELIVFCNTTSGMITLNIPASASLVGYKTRVIKTDSSSNSVVIDANASELINQTATYNLTLQNQNVQLESNSTQLYITN